MKTISKIRKQAFLNSNQILQVIGNVLMVIGTILVFIHQSERTYSFYWITLGITLLGSVLVLNQSSSDGKTQSRRADKNWDTKISGQGQDKIMLTMVIGVLLICSVFVIEFFYPTITRTLSSVIYSLIIMFIYQAITIYLSDKLYKEIIKTEKTINESNFKK